MDWTFRALVTRPMYHPRVRVYRQGIVETNPLCQPQMDRVWRAIIAVRTGQTAEARRLSELLESSPRST